MAHYGMARVIRGRDRAAAVAHLDAALQADPHLVDALQLRALERARLGDRGSLDDVELLVKAPTAHRLYNAACALAIYSDVAGDPQSLDRAMKLLELGPGRGLPGPAGGRRPRSPGNPEPARVHPSPGQVPIAGAGGRALNPGSQVRGKRQTGKGFRSLP